MQVDRWSGLETVVEGQEALMAAMAEAHSAYRRVGLVKLMDSSSGFTAINASMASGKPHRMNLRLHGAASKDPDCSQAPSGVSCGSGCSIRWPNACSRQSEECGNRVRPCSDDASARSWSLDAQGHRACSMSQKAHLSAESESGLMPTGQLSWMVLSGICQGLQEFGAQASVVVLMLRGPAPCFRAM